MVRAKKAFFHTESNKSLSLHRASCDSVNEENQDYKDTFMSLETSYGATTMMGPKVSEGESEGRWGRLMRKLFKLKELGRLQDTEENSDDSQLKRVLGTRDLVSLGVGSSVGTGMYLVSGMVARTMAGPGVVLSYAIAAMAALLSGLCYAELGVRVPRTTGSAYVYIYVTVGEFIAFVIGWNLILEYIIGTASCARALSACVDVLSSGALTNITSAWGMGSDMGSDLGSFAPDLAAFLITLLMTSLFFFGVKRSVAFNHILNGLNLLSWLLMMAVGLWFVRIHNWSDDFLPFGMAGVMKGAATCFYAFIGFDIIATTGEETHHPRTAIPEAIKTTLAIVTAAYVSSAAIMTLMVPYGDLRMEAGLVQVWGQLGYPSVEWLVSVGAVSALVVSMFGSMFPMPRIAYAMAKDGLLFSVMTRVSARGVPAVANLILGLVSAICALLLPLDVLVEMMSIGTLLAYTLVNACVLILRYQPDRSQSHFAHLFDKVAKVSMMSMLKMFMLLFIDEQDASRTSETSVESGNESVLNTESDKLGWFECVQLLVHGAHPLQQQRLSTLESGRLVVNVFLSLLLFIVLFDLLLLMAEQQVPSSVTVLSLLFMSGLAIICHLVSMAHFPQTKPQGFNTPGVPLIPVVAIIINFYLMLRLSTLTLVRFTIWMILGLLIYLKFGILESDYEVWS